MAKRKGASTSGPRARKKAAKEGSEAKISEKGAAADDEKEFCQLKCEVYPLLGELDKLSEQQRKLNHKMKAEEHKLEKKRLQLEVQRRKVEEQARELEVLQRDTAEQLRSLSREEETVQRNLLPKENRLKDMCSAREVENTQRLLGKLPQEVWMKILGHLENDDLFPLALSCRYFRQKQKELVARAMQNLPESGKPSLALKTNLKRKLEEGQPASAEYLRFCYKEKAEKPRSYYQKSDKGEYNAVLITRLAAFHGHLPLLQELRAGLKKLYPTIGLKRIFPEIAQSAARGGQLETLQWLRTQKGLKPALDEEIFREACEGGHLEVLRWLRSKGCPWNEDACRSAAGGGHLETLKWLRSKGCPWDEDACRSAAGGGHLEVLKWLRSEGCPWNEDACSRAAKGGHWEVLKWLRSEGCPWDEDAYSAAAQGGHLEIMKWLRSEGCPWDDYSCTSAAKGGHLEVLRWLRSEGCPWSAGTCSAAAKGGHLKILKWARSEGCPWDRWTWYYAAASTREWLKENGYPQNLRYV